MSTPPQPLSSSWSGPWTFPSSLSRSLPDFAPPWEKCMIVTMFCLEKSGKEEVSWGKSGFFSCGEAPCWLLSTVLPAVRVGQQTAPAAFITSSHARQVLEMAQGLRLYNLELLTNLNVSRRTKKQIQEDDFGFMLEHNPLWIVTWSKYGIHSLPCVRNLR